LIIGTGIPVGFLLLKCGDKKVLKKGKNVPSAVKVYGGVGGDGVVIDYM